MSERKLKPSSSRAYSAAACMRAGSTTSVVSPCASLISTRPGTPLKVTRSPERGDGSNHGLSACDSADLVSRRDAGEHLLVEPQDALHQRLRPRRATRNVHVDRDDLVDALEGRVVVEHPAGARAGAHRDHPLRLEHLVVDLPQGRRHLVHDAAGDDQEVGLSRRRTERLHAEARDVVSRGDDRHHLDRTAGEPEGVRPHRLRLRPRDGLLERRQADGLLERVDLALEHARAFRRPEEPLGAQAVVAEPLLYCHSSAPFRQMYTYATTRIAMKNTNSTNPNQASS